MLRIAILNQSRKDASSILYSLPKYTSEYRRINSITVFSSMKDFRIGVNDGNNFDMFFIYSDYRNNQISYLTHYIDLLKRSVNFILVSSSDEIIENVRLCNSRHLNRSFSYDKIRKTVNILLSRRK